MVKILHYLSILSGPLLACFCGSFLTLIPIRNVLEEFQYWYEDQLYKAIAVVPIFVISLLMKAEYWCNFSFERKYSTYLMSIGLSYCTYFIVITGYHLIWTQYLGHAQPLPMNQHLCGIAMVIEITITIWIRYDNFCSSC